MPRDVIVKLLYRARLRDWQMQSISLSLIWLCLSLWIRAKTVDQDERANAEHRAMFVGLWPSMFWLIGDALEREAQASSRLGRRRR